MTNSNTSKLRSGLLRAMWAYASLSEREKHQADVPIREIGSWTLTIFPKHGLRMLSRCYGSRPNVSEHG